MREVGTPRAGWSPALEIRGKSRKTPAQFEFFGSRDLKRLLLTSIAFRSKYHALPTHALLPPSALQTIANALSHDVFSTLTQALPLRTDANAAFSVYGAAAGRLPTTNTWSRPTQRYLTRTTPTSSRSLVGLAFRSRSKVPMNANSVALKRT